MKWEEKRDENEKNGCSNDVTFSDVNGGEWDG